MNFQIGDILVSKDAQTLQAELIDINGNKYHLINCATQWDLGWWQLQYLIGHWQKLNQENYDSLKQYAIKNGFVWKDE